MNDRMDPSYTNRTFLPDPDAPPLVVARRPTPQPASSLKDSICNPALILIIATVIALLAMAL